MAAQDIITPTRHTVPPSFALQGAGGEARIVALHRLDTGARG